MQTVSKYITTRQNFLVKCIGGFGVGGWGVGGGVGGWGGGVGGGGVGGRGEGVYQSSIGCSMVSD